MKDAKNILVLCTGNSCRSQIAHGWLNSLLKDSANVFSAGVETHGLNANAVKYMAEAGVDISSHTSNNVDEYQDIQFDYVITVCDHANERCPYFPNALQRLHHNFSDPSKVVGAQSEIDAAFRNTVSEIRAYCEDFVKEYFG